MRPNLLLAILTTKLRPIFAPPEIGINNTPLDYEYVRLKLIYLAGGEPPQPSRPIEHPPW